MPLFVSDIPSGSSERRGERPRDRRYSAVVVVPAFEAEETIEETLQSIAESVRFHRHHGGQGGVVISVVDGASGDVTPQVVSDFAERSELAAVVNDTALGCPELVVTDRTITSPQTFTGCRHLIAGPDLEVDSDVVMRAGETVVFRGDFSMAPGATLVVETNAWLRP